MQMLKLTNQRCPDAILRILADSEGVDPVTLHRIMAEEHDFTARQVANALQSLIQTGLIEQLSGARGWYLLTQAGRSAVSRMSEPRSLKEVVPHPGRSALDLLGGTVDVGVDNQCQPVRVPLWDSIGATHIVATGVSGAGTTNLLCGLVEATEAFVGAARTWVIDLGWQMSAYGDRVDRVASDLPAAEDMLSDVIKIQNDRSRVLTQAGNTGWSGPFSTPRMKLGLLVISGLHDCDSYSFSLQLERVAKAARKTGITIACDVPNLTLSCFGTPVVRDTLTAGTVLRMRSAGRFDDKIVNSDDVKFPAIDRSFPDGTTTAGLAYLPNGTLFRTYWASGL